MDFYVAINWLRCKRNVGVFIPFHSSFLIMICLTKDTRTTGI